jgi:hypothetical protein
MSQRDGQSLAQGLLDPDESDGVRETAAKDPDLEIGTETETGTRAGEETIVTLGIRAGDLGESRWYSSIATAELARNEKRLISKRKLGHKTRASFVRKMKEDL